MLRIVFTSAAFSTCLACAFSKKVALSGSSLSGFIVGKALSERGERRKSSVRASSSGGSAAGSVDEEAFGYEFRAFSDESTLEFEFAYKAGGARNPSCWANSPYSAMVYALSYSSL